MRKRPNRLDCSVYKLFSYLGSADTDEGSKKINKSLSNNKNRYSTVQPFIIVRGYIIEDAAL